MHVSPNLKKFCAGAALVVMLAAVGLTAFAGGDGEIQLRNGDFESSTDASPWYLPKGWSLVAGAGRNGSKAVVWDNDDSKHYAFASQKMAAEPGAGVVFSGWVKAERGDLADLRPKILIDWSDAKGKWMAECPARRVVDNDPNTRGWARFEGRLMFPAGAVTAQMLLVVSRGKTGRMGAPTTESGYQTRNVPHLVTLTNDYYIGVYEFTQKQYRFAYVGLGATALQSSADPSGWKHASDRDMRPVENRSWSDLRGDGKGDTTDYTWPTKGHAVNPSYMLGCMRKAWGIEFDLPTEAQWEYACRAGCGATVYYWGADVGDLAWYADNSAVDGVNQTHVVGLKRPNAFGLYDMIGNVQEWVLDMTGTMEYNVDGTPVLEPVGTTSGTANRVRKGCSYADPLTEARSAFYDDEYSQNARNPILGFRLCCPATLN